MYLGLQFTSHLRTSVLVEFREGFKVFPYYVTPSPPDSRIDITVTLSK